MAQNSSLSNIFIKTSHSNFLKILNTTLINTVLLNSVFNEKQNDFVLQQNKQDCISNLFRTLAKIVWNVSKEHFSNQSIVSLRILSNNTSGSRGKADIGLMINHIAKIIMT